MFRLALALGKSVREVEQFPNSEIDDWRAYYACEPFGQERDNYHAAQIVSMLANVNRSSDVPPFSTSDFMYKTESEMKLEQEEKAMKSAEAFFSHFDTLKEKGVVH